MDDVQSLLPFVPGRLLQRLLPQGERPEEPCETRFTAAALFIDVSGYSQLVEELSEEDSRGSERTQEILNSIFGPIASLTEAAGGEVLAFPGDAALALFPEVSSAPGAEPLTRACGAAAEAIRLLNDLRVEDDVVLRLRVAIGVGPVWAAILGGVGGRYSLLVRGAAIDQLGETLSLARPGEILLSPDAARLAGPFVRGERRGGALLLRSVDAPPFAEPTEQAKPSGDAVAAFVPRSVQERLAAGQHEFLAELRRVSVVFLHLPGLDPNETDALQRLQGAFVAIQETVQHYGGSVNQVVDDGNGTVFLLGFGVALHAHEDDGLRATLAALTMRDLLTRQGLDPRMGITSDVAFTGWRGGDSRAEYAMIGSTVNLAARLMAQADSILCDANTRLAVRRSVLFESIAPIWVKGRSDTVRVYRPRAIRSEARGASLLGQESSLVGRYLERQILERRLGELDTAREGGVVVIEAEAGVGKSSLLRHLIAAAQGTSVRIVVGAGESTGQKTPMVAWKPVIKALLGALVTVDAASVTARLRSLLGDEREEAFPVLDPLLPVQLTPTSLSRHISPQGRSDMIRGLFQRLLAATTARGPVLLVLDDGHWMDSASWELAESASEVPGILLVVAQRPMTQRPPPCQRLLENVATTAIQLDAIDEAETIALACQQLDVDTLPEEVARFIHLRAEGHPLFIEQLAQALRESGRLNISSHECQLVGVPEELNRLEMPETVSGLVRSRIDALEPEQQLTLKVASVLGRHFELEGLCAVHPLTDDQGVLTEQVRSMAALRLLQPRTDGSVGWSFCHALIQEAAYELLSYAHRRDFHLETAHWIEGRFELHPQEAHATLGHHYELADDHEAAIRHLSAAGDHAAELSKNTEVVHFFERVIQLDAGLGDTGGRVDAERASWERKAGWARGQLGELDRCWEMLTSALRRLGLSVPGRREGLLLGLSMRLLRLVARTPRPPRRTVKSEDEEFALKEAVRTLTSLSTVSYPRGALVEGLYLHLRALDVARRLGPCAELAHVYIGVANIAAMTHRLEIARSYASQAVDMAAREGDLSVWGSSLCVGQLFEVTVANFDALESIERGMEILWGVGDHYLWVQGAFTSSRLLMLKGELESSYRRVVQVLERAREGRNVVYELWALSEMADCQFRLGRLDEALSSARETLDLSQKKPGADNIAQFKAAGVFASAWLRRHGAPPPSEILHLGEVALENGGWQTYSPGSDFVGLAEGRLSMMQRGQGDRGSHLRSLEALAGRLKRTVFLRPVARPTQLWLQAEIDWHSGRRRRAARRLRKAIESADGYRLPFEGARIRVELARRLPREDPERGALLAAAEGAYQAIGSSWELTEVRRLR